MYRDLIDRAAVQDLLARLISIESINPHYADATTGEDRLAAFACEYLRGYGIECELVEVLPGRPNLLARLSGKSREGICLEAHMDTVGVEGYRGDPFLPRVRDNRMYGRGACDTKGSLATMMAALTALVRNGLTPATDVVLVGAMDEEYAFRGVSHLISQGYRAASAIVGEPTSLDVVVACKGCCRWTITSQGRAGHSSRPEEGRNAVYDMAALILKAESRLFPQMASRSHPLLGSPTASVGIIRGGHTVNVIPDQCSMEIDRRLIPGDSWPGIKAEWEALIAEVERERPGARFSMTEPSVLDTPLDTDPAHPFVQAALNMRATLNADGEPFPRVRGVTFGCDASKLSPAGFASIVFGPGDIAQGHTVEEWVDLDELVPAAAWYLGMLLGPGPEHSPNV